MSLVAQLARRLAGAEKPAARAVPPPRVAKNARKAKEALRPAPVEAEVADPPPSPPIVLPPLAAEAPPPPPPTLRAGWRGNCKAVSAATGRRCCLLEGHEAAHRHGSTAFVTVALTDDDVARARARMDAVATARRFDSSPHETP